SGLEQIAEVERKSARNCSEVEQPEHSRRARISIRNAAVLDRYLERAVQARECERRWRTQPGSLDMGDCGAAVDNAGIAERIEHVADVLCAHLDRKFRL